MLEYDGDLHIPSRYLVNPPEITGTMGEYLANTGVTQLAISETQKFGHVTYFWNGNRSGKFSEDTETYIEIKSDVVPFEQRPWMKCADIADTLIDCLRSGKYRSIRVNFPNGDMVGHTGSLPATICSMEALDLQLGRILPVVDEVHGAAIICADHGNADEMYEIDKKSGQPKEETAAGETLFLKFPSIDDPAIRHMKLVFQMFPGKSVVKMVKAHTRQVYAPPALLHPALVQEALETLGHDNVVVKY